MFHFQTQFNSKTKLLAGCDKLYLAKNSNFISNELIELRILLGSSNYISRKHRRMLITSINLANIFGYFSNENQEFIIKDRDAPMASNSHLKTTLKNIQDGTVRYGSIV